MPQGGANSHHKAAINLGYIPKEFYKHKHCRAPHCDATEAV